MQTEQIPNDFAQMNYSVCIPLPPLAVQSVDAGPRTEPPRTKAKANIVASFP